MKQKDIAIIAVVVLFSAGLSIVLSQLVFAKKADRQQSVEVVQPIKSEFPAPDERYFNNKSIDPTLPIEIGNNNNQDPFKNPAQ